MGNSLDKIIFLDIETVTEYESFSDLAENNQPLADEWDRKAAFFRGENKRDVLYRLKGGIFSEFSKVICVSVGFISFINPKTSALEVDKKFSNFQLKIKSIYSNNEVDILINLKNILDKSEGYVLCAHNGKEFDYPFLSRRYIINGLKIPFLLDLQGRKPWEINLLDTMEMWKFGDYKHFTSLDLLTKVLKIKSSKSIMSGDKVHEEYYLNKDLKKIAKYCESDIIALVKVYLKLVQNFTPLLDENIIRVK